MLYGDDSVLMAESREYFQEFVNEFQRACDRFRLKINESENKVLMVKNYQRNDERN